MPDIINSPFDIIVYLIPGALLLVAIVFRCEPDRLRHAQEKIGLGELLVGLVAAILLGIIALRLSGVVLPIARLVYGEGILAGMVRTFPELSSIRETVDAKVKLGRNGDIWYYHYARAVVEQKVQASTESAQRLYSLALLCRSMLLCVPTAALILASAYTKQRPRPWRKAVILIGALTGLELIFAHAFLSYWAAAVWKFLRAYVVLQAFG